MRMWQIMTCGSATHTWVFAELGTVRDAEGVSVAAGVGLGVEAADREGV